MADILVLAPHPDDESIGCGGTLLKRRAAGHDLHWVIVTEMTSPDYSAERIARRETEIEAVRAHYPFASVTRLGHPTAHLDRVDIAELVQGIAQAIAEIQPAEMFVPFPGDAHSDHRAVHDAAVAASKWFRAPSVKNVLAYECLSETDIVRNLSAPAFVPNIYEDIGDFLEDKCAALALYGEEMGAAPFPRSEAVVRAKALVRGAEAGFMAAEAFMLVKELRS